MSPALPFSGPLPAFVAVIVAAGKGLRAGQPAPKQFAMWRGKPVLRHSADAFAKAGASVIVVVIPQGADALARDALSGIEGVALVTGGASRQESVRLALESLVVSAPERVLIHDAARPDLPQEIIGRLLDALGIHQGAIPALPVVDSLATAVDGLMTGTADRAIIWRVQTPQAFSFSAILAAHRCWAGHALAGDDAQVARAAGMDIALVDGDERMHKLTFAEDFLSETSAKMPSVRIGTGFDVHRLVPGEEMWLCGIQLDHTHGLSGQSDADVALHAVVDALLGAAGAGDIGDHFPPSEAQWKGASSDRFVTHAVALVVKAGYRIGNVDLTIICEAPKIGPHRDAMRQRLAELLGIHVNCVSVKATTTERLGYTGRGEGIAAQAAATIMLD